MSRTVEVDPIADLRSPTGSLITVYPRRPAPGGFAALLTDLLRPIREWSEHQGRAVALAVRSDSERIRDLAGRFELEPAPAYVVFASSIDEVFIAEQLAHETPDVAVIGPRPYMRPLRAAPRSLRSGVIVADHVIARVFTATGGVPTEIGPAVGADIGKPNFGGFSGYDEHVARSRAGLETSRMWRAAVQRLVTEHVERPLDYIALGTHDELTEDLSRSLHPYLARLPRVTFHAGPGTVTHKALRTELLGHDLDVRRQRQAALAGRVCDVAWSNGNAVLGLSPTIDAANVQAIDTLVVAGGVVKEGAMCRACSRLSRAEEVCAVCGSATFAIGDVVAAVMEAVIATGGDVHQVEVATPLDNDGIGALTRFPVAV